MNTKHTPGPWHHDEYGHICAKNQIIGSSYQFELDDSDHDELPCLENARLMAASTEMYELMPKLVEMLGYMAYILDQSGSYDTSEARSLADEWIDIRTKIEGDE